MKNSRNIMIENFMRGDILIPSLSYNETGCHVRRKKLTLQAFCQSSLVRGPWRQNQTSDHGPRTKDTDDANRILQLPLRGRPRHLPPLVPLARDRARAS